MNEVRQQLQAWQEQLHASRPGSSADIEVAGRLIRHGLNALDRIASLEAQLAAVQEALTLANSDRATAWAECAALRAERDAARKDAERGKWMVDHAEWWRDGDETRMVIRVADKADLSCYAMRELAVDAERIANCVD